MAADELQGFLERHQIPVELKTGNERPQVLVVDDDEDVLKAWVRQLARRRFDVLIASSGYDALLMIGDMMPDLVVLDLVMPRVDGFEVCRSIKRSRSTSKVKSHLRDRALLAGGGGARARAGCRRLLSQGRGGTAAGRDRRSRARLSAAARPMVARRLALVLFALAPFALAGCTPPHWSDARTDLDRVPLSVWASGGKQFIVGGPLGSAGQGLFLRHDGGGWHESATGSSATLWWVFGLGESDIWTVGELGTVLHWNGAQLAPETVPATETLFGVWGVSDDDLWAVGGRPDIDGVILHRTSGTWNVVAGLPNSGAFFKVWGSAADDVFVCGQGGTILHWDGAAWSPQSTGLMANASLFTVAGRVPSSGADDVYAVGGLGNAVALHLNSPGWQSIDDAALTEAPALAGVAVASDGTVAMVGSSGLKLRGRPGAFHDESDQATRADFHSVGFQDHDSGELWAVGGNWLAPAPAARHGVVVHYF